MLWLPSAYLSCMYMALQSVECESDVSKKKKVLTLTKGTLLLKYANHHLTTQGCPKPSLR